MTLLPHPTPPPHPRCKDTQYAKNNEGDSNNMQQQLLFTRTASSKTSWTAAQPKPRGWCRLRWASTKRTGWFLQHPSGSPIWRKVSRRSRLSAKKVNGKWSSASEGNSAWLMRKWRNWKEERWKELQHNASTQERQHRTSTQTCSTQSTEEGRSNLRRQVLQLWSGHVCASSSAITLAPTLWRQAGNPSREPCHEELASQLRYGPTWEKCKPWCLECLGLPNSCGWNVETSSFLKEQARTLIFKGNGNNLTNFRANPKCWWFLMTFGSFSPPTIAAS